MPGAPSSYDMDTTWCGLKWDEPSYDGGSPILGYVVEYKEPQAAKWMPGNHQLCSDPRLVIDNLREKGTYEFRGEIIGKVRMVSCKPHQKDTK